jgi:nitrogen-specific signal transduction histidine kinase
LKKTGSEDIVGEFADVLTFDYSLASYKIARLDYGRVMAIQQNIFLDSARIIFDGPVTSPALISIIHGQPAYSHEYGDEKYMMLFPAEYSGSKYIIGATQENNILATIENARRVLVFSGLMVFLVILTVLARLIKNVIRPFRRLQDSVEYSGRMVNSGDDDITRLRKSYESIIDDLRQKESELVELNKAISQKADRLEAYNDYILRSINAGIITIDNQQNLSSINRAAAELLKIDAVDSIGQSYREILRDYSPLLELIESCLISGELVSNSEIRLTIDSSHTNILNVSLSTLFDSNSKAIGLAVIMSDQTDFIKIQEELELNRRLATLGEMSGGLAHQLRNSTAAIIGFARLIEKKLPAESKLKKTSGLLESEALQAESLVARFLDFAKPLQANKEKLILSNLIEEIIILLKRIYRNIEFTHTDIIQDGFEIIGDSLLLKQAIGNVAENACNAYDGTPGSVEIKLNRVDNAILIEIADQGSGIPDEFKDQIFTPFFSGSPSGSGLGLPLAGKIVVLHNGHIDFKPNSPLGTVFKITLPVSAADKSKVREAQNNMVKQ